MQNNNGVWLKYPYCYDLNPGEQLVDATPPRNITRPKWNGSKWIETATPAEIEAAKPEPVAILPSLEQRIQATEQALLILMMGEQ